MNKKESRWFRWQRGQAMSEYWPTLGASVAFLTLSAGLALGVWDFYRTAVDSFNRVGAGRAGEVCTVTQSDAEGSADSVELAGSHNVTFVSSVYNADNDTTTVAYRITSGESPSISHVVFGMASCAEVVQTSEPYEMVNPDPTTGAVGIKFDTGYEDGESRTVVITLRGEYQMGDMSVTTKAGGGAHLEIGTGSVTGPVQCGAETLDDTQEDLVYEGCVPD